MKKIKISSFDEEVLANFGFTPESLNEMYDVLSQTSEIIEAYAKDSAEFTDEMRNKIGDLKMTADTLFLDFNNLYMMTSDLIEKFKKLKLKQDVKIHKKEVNLILTKKKKLKKQIMQLIEDTEQFIKKLKKIEKQQPLI
jgi:ElaB/YqjD/DUF883 family membrane-anchored ribosome-binding protein